MLSKNTIAAYVESQKISIKPHFSKQQLRPFGIRVHLAHEVFRPIAGAYIDVDSDKNISRHYKAQNITQHGLVLKPGDFVLGSTVESVRVDPSIYCILDGRSTLARLGIAIHCTAHIIDGNNFEYRSIVLEIKNVGNMTIRIPHLYGIGCLGFGVASCPLEQSDIQDQYAHQKGVTLPNLSFKIAPYRAEEDRNAD